MHISKKIEMVACPGFLFRIMRKEHKLTLKCLTVDVGISESYYSKVESGQIIPSMDVNDRMIGFYQLYTFVSFFVSIFYLRFFNFLSKPS